MPIFRVLVLLTALFCARIAHALPAPSARKIAPVEVGFVESMTISRDGRFLSVLSIPGEKGSDCLIIDRRTHKTTMLLGSSRMEPLCFSRDGRRLCVWGLHLDETLPGLKLKAADKPFIALYDLRRGRYVRALSGVREDSEVPGDGVLSRDGRTLIYATTDGWVCGFSLGTGRVKWRHRAQDNGDGPVSIEMSPDGAKFLRTSDDENGEAQSAEVVSTRNGRVLSTLRLPFAHPGAMRSAFSGAKFAPRGAQIAVFQSDTQEWVFFNSRTGRVQWKMGGASRNSEGDLSWQWSPDARFVGVSGPKGFQLRDARTGRILETSASLGGDALTFSPDGSRVYAFQDSDTGFGAATDLWQWRLFPTRSQRRADTRFMRHLRSQEARFALSPRHRDESLTMAARRGDPKRVALLLNRGANIEVVDRNRSTPLENAVDANSVYGGPQRSFATAKLLIERGANLKTRAGSLLAGAAVNSTPLLKLLLAHGVSANSNASHYGTATALHAAAQFCQLESVRLLLQHGADPNARDENGATPLMTVIEYSGSESPIPIEPLLIARLLLEHGADVNAASTKGLWGVSGDTALSKATQRVNRDMMKLLLEHGANPRAKNSQAETPLWILTQMDWTDDDLDDGKTNARHAREAVAALQILISHGVDVRGKDGHLALAMAPNAMVQAALKKAGAKP